MPLVKIFKNIKFVAFDFSEKAIEVLQNNIDFDSYRIECHIWDALNPECFPMYKELDSCLCIFTLSSVHPDLHLDFLKNCKYRLKSHGIILIRDYALYDMTMFRHKVRLGEKLFRRKDGTLAYYFDLKDIEFYAAELDLDILSLQYATVALQNRKASTKMFRVFLHGVLSKK
jgi:SAM-dependent methyltransferase